MILWGEGFTLLSFSLLLWCCDLPLAVLSSLLEAFLRYLVTLGFPLQCNKRGGPEADWEALSMWWGVLTLAFFVG